MAGPDTGQSGPRTSSPGPAARRSLQPQLGAVGEASQLVEAALQARTAASQDQRFATTKTLFFALSSLSGALRLELRHREVGQVSSIACRRNDEECAVTIVEHLHINRTREFQVDSSTRKSLFGVGSTAKDTPQNVKRSTELLHMTCHHRPGGGSWLCFHCSYRSYAFQCCVLARGVVSGGSPWKCLATCSLNWCCCAATTSNCSPTCALVLSRARFLQHDVVDGENDSNNANNDDSDGHFFIRLSLLC